MRNDMRDGRPDVADPLANPAGPTQDAWMGVPRVIRCGKGRELKQSSTEKLAQKLILGQGGRKASFLQERQDPASSWGRAVFLIGAGCSASAGIPLAAGIAKRCAVELARIYRAHDEPDWNGRFEDNDHDDALEWLISSKRVADQPPGGRLDWGKLYSVFFEQHLGSPNQQRAMLTKVIEDSGHRLNWAHACLGELVRLRYVHTILTTNFDQLILKGMVRAGVFPVVVEGLEGLNRITAEPRHPQLVHLHGSLHTYDTRNSGEDVRNTETHASLGAVLYALLQQSDVLVVVGYYGGEEGIMTLLDRAALEFRNTVVYWVLYEDDESSLSPRARQLLGRGANKFIITGTDADRFFRELMNELKIGLPRWIREPTSTLTELLRDIVPVPGKGADPDIRAVLEAFTDAVRHVETQASPDIMARVAALRLKGDYMQALEALPSAEPGIRRDRLIAVTKYDMAQLGLREEELRTVVDAFEQISGEGDSQERLMTVRQLLPALISLHDLTSDDALLERVVQHCDNVLSSGDGLDDTARIELAMRRALALQVMGERGGDEKLLQAALGAYEEVAAERTQSRDAVWAEAKMGAATIHQALGEVRNNTSYLELAVQALREIVSASDRLVDPTAEAARRFNLAGALSSFADAAPQASQGPLQEAETQLERALSLYGDAGDPGEQEARRLLASVRLRLSGSQSREPASSRPAPPSEASGAEGS